MGKKFLITESEKKNIKVLYEQQVKSNSKYNTKDIEIFKSKNFHFNYDDIDDKITTTYNNLNTNQFIFFYKSITKNKIVYGLMFTSQDIDNTYGGDNFTILFTDNTRFTKENVRVSNGNATLLLTPQEALLFTTKIIKKYRIVRTTDVLDSSEAINFRDGVKTIYKISYNDIQFIQKYLPETKKEELPVGNTENEPQKDETHTMVQLPAEFPGGTSGWQRYLDRTLDKTILQKNNAPEGKYDVIISFDVSKDGSISNVETENNPGYGTKEEAIRVIKNGPKWKPAVQDGRNVNYKMRTTISFN